MLIFWDQKLVFLATPKAGSTAVRSALESLASAAIQRPAPLKHADIRTFRRHIGPWIGEQAGGAFSTVALMREPVDWLRSWYRFRLRDDLDGPLHQMNDVSFAQFASDYAQDGGPSRMGIGRQCDFLIDGEHRVDRIFRYENFPPSSNILKIALVARWKCLVSTSRPRWMCIWNRSRRKSCAAQWLPIWHCINPSESPRFNAVTRAVRSFADQPVRPERQA